MKVKIHPLFFAVMIFCAFYGGLPITLIYVLTALLHECGHVFCAAKMGFECESIKIMPYGAAAVCNLEGISARDEVRVALAGPLVNAAICLFLGGLWWFFPITYAFTDTVLWANASMLIINMLPVHPLDGGRVARCFLKKAVGARKAEIILRSFALTAACGLAAVFFACGFNLTFLIFALFLVASAIEKNPEATKIDFSCKGKIKRGMEVKYVLCDGELTFKDAIKLLDDRRYLVLVRYDGQTSEKITQDELYEAVLSHGVYDKVFHFSKNDLENFSSSNSPRRTSATHSAPNATASSTAPASE